MWGMAKSVVHTSYPAAMHGDNKGIRFVRVLEPGVLGKGYTYVKPFHTAAINKNKIASIVCNNHPGVRSLGKGILV